MTTHTHADLIAETRELLNERWLVRFGSEHKDVKNLLTRLAGALHSSEGKAMTDAAEYLGCLVQSSEGKATEGETPFEIGCTVKLKDADLVGTLLEFNEPITGALIRWSHNGDEIWKALRNLEVVSQPSEGEGPGADICAVHCSICEGMDHHWDYFGDEIDGEPVYSCKHCEAIKSVEDADDALASPSPPVSREADELGKWLSAALDDPNVCDAMKADINAWFNADQPVPSAAVLVSREAVARVLDRWFERRFHAFDEMVEVIVALVQPLAGRKWQPIETYPAKPTLHGDLWGPEVLVLTPPTETHLILKGESTPPFTMPPQLHVAHLEAGMWLVRVADDPVAWTELFAAPTHWFPAPPLAEGENGLK